MTIYYIIRSLARVRFPTLEASSFFFSSQSYRGPKKIPRRVHDVKETAYNFRAFPHTKRKSVSSDRNREKQRRRRGTDERVNPESHGNLVTSAIGLRTCTRSNLKGTKPYWRERENERENERETRHSFICTRAIRVYARSSHSHRTRALFLFAVYRLRRELGATGPPGTYQRKYFHCNEGPSSLHFRLQRPRVGHPCVSRGDPRRDYQS